MLAYYLILPCTIAQESDGILAKTLLWLCLYVLRYVSHNSLVIFYRQYIPIGLRFAHINLLVVGFPELCE